MKDELKPKVEIKTEIKLEPCEYFEHLSQITDLLETIKTENNNVIKSEVSLKESHPDYIKTEEIDLKMKMKEEKIDLDNNSQEKPVYHLGLADTVGEACLFGMVGVRVHLPLKLNDLPDYIIREFIQSSYGKISYFARKGKSQAVSMLWNKIEYWIIFDEEVFKSLRKQGLFKRKKGRPCARIIFEGEKANKCLRNNGYVMPEDVQLDG